LQNGLFAAPVIVSGQRLPIAGSGRGRFSPLFGSRLTIRALRSRLTRFESEGGYVPRQRHQWPLRIAGCLFGLGCWAIGLFSIFGGSDTLPELNRERALGFGVTAIVVGLVAVIGSLTSDAHRLWYCVPRRWRPFRADVLDDWGAPRSPAPRGLTPSDRAGAEGWSGRNGDRS
jgi:hypothetical protein